MSTKRHLVSEINKHKNEEGGDGSIKERLRQKEVEEAMLFEEGELECLTGLLFLPEEHALKVFGGERVLGPDSDTDASFNLDVCRIMTNVPQNWERFWERSQFFWGEIGTCLTLSCYLQVDWPHSHGSSGNLPRHD